MSDFNLRSRVCDLASDLFEADGGFENQEEAMYAVLVDTARAYLALRQDEPSQKFTVTDLWGTVQSLHENLEPEARDFDPRAPFKLLPLHSATTTAKIRGEVVEIFAIYRMVRIEAEHNLVTGETRITGASDAEHARALKGMYGSINKATTATIRHLAPSVSPVRKWRAFWKVTSDMDLGVWLDRRNAQS